MDQNLTLYLSIQDGANIDLRTLAKSALSFDDLIKEVAFQFEPGIELRVELKSTTSGSLKINSIIKAIKENILTKEARVAILTAISMHFLSGVADITRDHVIERILEIVRAEEELNLTEDEVNAIAEGVYRKIREGLGRQEAERLLESLASDERITGVGIATSPDVIPFQILPRSEFSGRSKLIDATSDADHRTLVRELEVILVSPVLVKSNRRWRFRGPYGEFGASVKDEVFLDNVLRGNYHIPMRAGITLLISLETVEELIEGVWRTKTHSIVEVKDSFGVNDEEDLFSSCEDRMDNEADDYRTTDPDGLPSGENVKKFEGNEGGSA